MASAEQQVSGGSAVGLGLYSPPANVDRYAEKPLPPLPLQRNSVASSSGSEVTHASMSPKTTNQNVPFMFDWEVESSGRTVRLHQSLGPDDLMPIRLRPKQHSFSGIGSDPTGLSTPTAGGYRPGPSSLTLERRIAQATAGPDPRPPPGHRHTFPTVPVNKIIIPTVPPDEILSPQPKSSVQKILKLTGNMSPTTTLSTDTPSLHNSTQKIGQLTGLDLGPRRDSENQLEALQEEASPPSSIASPSLHSHESPEVMSYDIGESIDSRSYAESINELNTPLAAAPRYIAAMSSPAHLDSLRDDKSRTPVKAALRLSGFIAADIGVTMLEDRTPVAGRRESWFEDHSEGEDSHSSSSSEVSESEFEMEPTAAELYHDSAVAIAKSSPSLGSSGGGDGGEFFLPKPPGNIRWESKFQQESGDTRPISRSRGSTQGSLSSTIGSTLSHSPSPSRPFTLNPFRKKDALAERRGHAPSPLDSTASALPPSSSSSSRGNHQQPQRTPYPPVSSSSIKATVEETEDGQARLSLLARIFTTGSGSSVSSSKRDSTASGASSSGRAASVASGTKVSIGADKGPAAATTSAWSPDTPSPGTTTFGDASRHSAGLLARTMDHARQAAGRRSKAEKGETKRGSLKGKIEVLRGGGGHVSELDKLSSPGS